MAVKTVKFIAFLLAFVLTLPFVVLAWLEGKVSSSEALFGTFAQLLAIMPGPLGRFLRAAYYVGTLDACSWEVHVGFGCLFTHRGARLAAHVSMGSYCVIGHATLGEGVRMASRISIPSGKRQHLDDSGEMTDNTVFERVSIGAGAWIGEAATILADVGERSIVSAGAVVIKAVPPDCIAGGNPAKTIKELSPAVSGAGS